MPYQYPSYNVESIVITQGICLAPAMEGLVTGQFGMYINLDVDPPYHQAKKTRGGKGVFETRKKTPHYYIYKTPLRKGIRISAVPLKSDSELLMEEFRFSKELPDGWTPLRTTLKIVRKEPTTFDYVAKGGISIGGVAEVDFFDFGKFVDAYF